jgi:hypothetical protein
MPGIVSSSSRASDQGSVGAGRGGGWTWLGGQPVAWVSHGCYGRWRRSGRRHQRSNLLIKGGELFIQEAQKGQMQTNQDGLGEITCNLFGNYPIHQFKTQLDMVRKEFSTSLTLRLLVEAAKL